LENPVDNKHTCILNNACCDGHPAIDRRTPPQETVQCNKVRIAGRSRSLILVEPQPTNRKRVCDLLPRKN